MGPILVLAAALAAAPAAAQTAGPNLAPLFRLMQPQTLDRFYTDNADTAKLAEGLGYVPDSPDHVDAIEAYVYKTQASGTTPLYRLYNARLLDHFYTIDPQARDAAISQFGYALEGVEGYVPSSQVPGSMPFFRLYNPTILKHFYTSDPQERDLAVQNGYQFERIEGYVVPYFELSAPTTGTSAVGVMLVIHGGGWEEVGRAKVWGMRPEADRWRAQGWETYSFTYPQHAPSVDTVAWMYDQARATFGPNTMICAIGQSAGGHLALELAARRADLACAIAQAGPTELPTLEAQTTIPFVKACIPDSFGTQLTAYSPADNAGTIRAPLLLATSAYDQWVPYSQALLMKQALPAKTTTMELAGGTITFVHAGVSQDALNQYYALEASFIAAARQSWASR